MPMLETRAKIELADANLLESIREHARWQDPCDYLEQDGVLLVAGANPLPIGYRNCAVRVNRNVAAAEALKRAREFFAARRRGFAVLTRASVDGDLESLLIATGLQSRRNIPCMLIETPLADIDPPPGVRIEQFVDERHVRDTVGINAEAYQAIGLPMHETPVYFGRPSALLSERVIGYIAYRGTQPLATALTIMSGQGAGVYWVGTITSAQRMGLGSLCTRLATNAGFARGAAVVTLQASAFGEPVYRRLGYQTYDRMNWYGHPAPG